MDRYEPRSRCGTDAARLVRDDIQRLFFHAAAKHATTHQPSIELDFARAVLATDDDGDDAVVAEAIDKANLQSERVRVLQSAQPLRSSVYPARRQIELVRLVDELDDARQADAIEGLQCSPISMSRR